MQMTLHLHKLL